MSNLREHQLDSSVQPIKSAAKCMEKENVSTNAVRAKSLTKRTTAIFFIRTSVQHHGKLHQRKMQELEEEKGQELIETEVKQEVEIEGGRNPKIVVGGNSLHTNPETGLRE